MSPGVARSYIGESNISKATVATAFNENTSNELCIPQIGGHLGGQLSSSASSGKANGPGITYGQGSYVIDLKETSNSSITFIYAPQIMAPERPEADQLILKLPKRKFSGMDGPHA